MLIDHPLACGLSFFEKGAVPRLKNLDKLQADANMFADLRASDLSTNMVSLKTCHLIQTARWK